MHCEQIDGQLATSSVLAAEHFIFDTGEQAQKKITHTASVQILQVEQSPQTRSGGHRSAENAELGISLLVGMFQKPAQKRIFGSS